MHPDVGGMFIEYRPDGDGDHAPDAPVAFVFTEENCATVTLKFGNESRLFRPFLNRITSPGRYININQKISKKRSVNKFEIS